MSGMLRPIVGAVVVAVLGCGDAASGRAGGGRVDSNAGSYSVSFESSPRPIPLNQPFDVAFTVSARGGAKLGAGSPVSVDVDARMPAHRHGMSRAPKVTLRPDGTYLAQGLMFHMPGRWELYFDITEGGRTERAQVDVDLE